MQYSPKLKKAMQEIKDILSKYDIAGLVTITEPGFSEFLCKIDPTWSSCRFNGDQIKVKIKLEDFAGDVGARNKAIADTSNMLHMLSDTTGRILLPIMDLSEMIDTQVDAKHDKGGFTSHNAQNN